MMKTQRKRYYAKLRLVNHTIEEKDYNPLDGIPEDGEAVDYDARGTLAYLSQLTDSEIADLPIRLEDQELAFDGPSELVATKTLPKPCDISSGTAKQPRSTVPSLPVNTPVIAPLPPWQPPLVDHLADFERILFDAESDVPTFVNSAINMLSFMERHDPGRPLHFARADGTCPALCGEVLDKWEHRTRSSHINTCLANAALEAQLPVLLQRYPHTFPYHPAPSRNKKLAFRPRQTATDVYKLAKLVKGARLPVYCRCGEMLGSRSLAHAHFATHGWHISIFMPNAEKDVKAAYTQGTWDKATARFPLPYYSFDDGKYYPDPASAELACQQSYESRILKTSVDVKGYLARDDLTQELDLPAEPNAPEQGRVIQDMKYEMVKSLRGIICQPALCLFCVNDPGQSYLERMSPAEDLRNHQVHCVFHLKAQIEHTMGWKQFMAPLSSPSRSKSSAVAKPQPPRRRIVGSDSESGSEGERATAPTSSGVNSKGKGKRLPVISSESERNDDNELGGCPGSGMDGSDGECASISTNTKQAEASTQAAATAQTPRTTSTQSGSGASARRNPKQTYKDKDYQPSEDESDSSEPSGGDLESSEDEATETSNSGTGSDSGTPNVPSKRKLPATTKARGKAVAKKKSSVKPAQSTRITAAKNSKRAAAKAPNKKKDTVKPVRPMGGQRYRPPPIIFHTQSGGWKCPDLVCQRVDLHYEADKLHELVRHLALFHRYPLGSKVYSKNIPTTTDVLPEDIMQSLLPDGPIELPESNNMSINSLRGFRAQPASKL